MVDKVGNIPSIYELLREALEQEELVDIKYIKDLNAVIASVGGNRVGALRVKPFKEGYQVDTVSVSPDYRKLGIGTEMYRVAFEALNSLYSDKHQTPAAKRIWDSLISSGEAEKVGERYKMLKASNTLHENYGGPGEMEFPETHQAGMKVTKGGSMCANCEYWEEKGNICNSKYWQKWAKVEEIPYPADEYCCNWWEPAPKGETDAED